ncbi:MAG: AIM24 family protein, partial [Alphaproteobacteria bacterium]|nr:AIM24 family protein [Alphaproteobacteria bacterium]
MAVEAQKGRWDQESLQQVFGIHGTVREQERAPFDSSSKNDGVVDISHRGNSSMATITVPSGGGVIFGSDIKPDRGAQNFHRYPGLSRFFTWAGYKGKISGENIMLKSYFNETAKPQVLGIDEEADTGLIGFDLAKAPDGIVAPTGSLVLATIPSKTDGPDIDFKYKPLLNKYLGGDPAFKQHITGKGTALMESYGATDVTVVRKGESVPINPKRLVAYDGGLTRTYGVMTRNASSI